MKRAAPIVLLVIVVLLFTLFNKRWIGRRIAARWDVHTGTEPKDPWTIYGPDWTKWSLPQLWGAWANGRPNWYAKGQTPELATATEYNVE